jgi:predicted MFS family arabinose efflux permease
LGFSLDDSLPYRLALCLAPAGYLLGAILFTRAKSIAARAQTRSASIASHRFPKSLFLFFGVMISLQAFGEGTVRNFFNIYLDSGLQMPPDQIGWIMGITQLFLILISFSLPAILARRGSVSVLAISATALSFLLLVLAWVPNQAAAAGAYLGINGLLVVMAVSRGLYSQESVSVQWRTSVSAVSTIALALGWGLAAWLGGNMVPEVGFPGVFTLGALLALLSVGVLAFWTREADGRPSVAEETNSHAQVTRKSMSR